MPSYLMMIKTLLNVFYFLFITLLFHPLFIAFSIPVLLFIIISRLSSHGTRHVEEVDLLWLKSLSSVDSIRLVWCDPCLETEYETEKLLRTIDPALVLITDPSLCDMMVKKLHHDECKSIFLVLSGSVADELLIRVTPNVHTIFIFCFDQTKYSDLKSRPKIDIISDSPSILIERIKYCWSSVERLYVTEHEQQSLRNLTKERATFIWFHVLRNVIRHFKKSPQAKSDMMERFQEYYQSNPKQLERLFDFANTYESDYALWWYTQPSFISDIINKTLRARDIDALFSLRYCIVDLCQLLEELPRPTEHLIVYRGVLMDRDKFEKMKETMGKGDLVSTRGFLSTARNRKIVEHFGSNDNHDPNKIEIIYEIDVPVGLERIICADIKPFSQFEKEEEILFDLDSSFELIKIVRDPEKEDRWIIQLQASDKDGLHVLSRVDRGIAMNHIGHAWHNKGDYDRALQWFNSALAIQQQEPELTYHMAMTMNNKGVLLMMAGKWQLAFTAFEHAADITSRLSFYDDLASAFGNMGAIKDQIGEYEEALNLYRRAGEALQAAGIHKDHPSVAENEMKIAFVYMNQARWNDALDTLYKVRDIRERILPASHADMGRTWFTIGLVLRNQQRYDDALEHMKRALAIYERAYSYEHPNIANTYNSMANLKAIQDQYAEALPFYEQAKEKFRQFYGTNEHPDIARVLNNMGQAHRHLGHLSEALDYFGKALHMREVTLGANHPDTATTLVNLSLAYRVIGDLKSALEYAQHGLNIRRDKLQPEHEDLIETENFVVQLKQEILALDQEQNADNAKDGGA
ncbi:unnamed protein product [Rotaria sp. Silwood1]|nr:unnamed protein product [Rotaria sp. Silwood1]CAF1630854.1 unnamed protein product [Rotaria sp. Silwood1]CAF3799857.1 unnamed protein product [Rotaria sp. Silwood1]CAF3832146.1 unnamed protein product [Rotaria sp. Silwood1]CAF4808671.1 unnamed protein product [Rotaria sp. Silwood1]